MWRRRNYPNINRSQWLILHQTVCNREYHWTCSKKSVGFDFGSNPVLKGWESWGFREAKLHTLPMLRWMANGNGILKLFQGNKAMKADEARSMAQPWFRPHGKDILYNLWREPRVRRRFMDIPNLILQFNQNLLTQSECGEVWSLHNRRNARCCSHWNKEWCYSAGGARLTELYAAIQLSPVKPALQRRCQIMQMHKTTTGVDWPL